MAYRFQILAGALASLAIAGFAAPASAGIFGGGNGDGVLKELPAHPAAGTCYARVKVLTDDRGPPPGPHAIWKETPALPGAVGPTWCLVDDAGYGPSASLDKFGWVRVLCDQDVTPLRVRTLQSKLRAHGDYTGEETGRYDQATADAVARFQQAQHIDHGGYLSLQTVDAIEHAEARSYAPTPSGLPALHVSGCCNVAPPPPPEKIYVPVPQPYPVRVEVKVPVPYEVRVPVRVEVPVPQPYPVRVEVPVPQPYPVQVPVRVPVPVPQPYPVQVPVQVPVPQPYPVQVPVPYPVYQPAPQPCCQAPIPMPQPCCQAPPAPQPCCQGARHATGYIPDYGRDRSGWLSWPGKSAF